MKASKVVTCVILIATLILWLVWDIIVAANSVPGDTISEITLAASYLQLFIPAACGTVAGHLFWPSESASHGTARIMALCWWGAAAIVVSALDVIPGTMATVPITFLASFVVGHFLWPQLIAPRT